MVFSLKTAALGLLSFGLSSRQAMAVISCPDLISAVGAAATEITITLEADFYCDTQIDVAAAQVVRITGDFTITIGAGFSSTSADAGSLFVNEGILSLDSVTFDTLANDGIRAVWNSGTLSVTGCSFSLLSDGAMISRGGVIYSDSDATVDIQDSTFESNVVSDRGGAICAVGNETLTVTDCIFRNNEVGTGEAAEGAGGDIYADRDVALTVDGTLFSGSTAEFGGAAIECCGATITNSTFSGTDSSSDLEHFGALLVGRRDATACTNELSLTEVNFAGCTVGHEVGMGGSLAIFDTSATLLDCKFEESVGTAVFFESSSAAGEHRLEMENVEFNYNRFPAETYASADSSQGAAIVMVNSAVVADGGDAVNMGEFFKTYCFLNDPYECEFVFDGVDITDEGDFKCNVCDIDGVKTISGDDDAASRDIPADQDSSWGSKDYIIAGLSGVLGLLLILAIGVLVLRRCNHRTPSDEAQAPPPPPAATSLPAATSASAATAPPASTGAPATTGTIEPAAHPR
ncbi:unnamed protein product [Pylaiella littoralis]